MSMRFPYHSFAVSHPLAHLGGRTERPRPIVAVTLIGPSGSSTLGALVDTGADDTVFHESEAVKIGLDLSNAPTVSGAGIGMNAVGLRFAQLTLRIADDQEQHEWISWVGFTSAKLRYPLLGFAGFLQYFSATFLGDQEEVELTINSLYPGT